MDGELLDTLTKRHNELVNNQQQVEDYINNRDETLKNFRVEVKTSLNNLREEIKETEKLFEELQRTKKNISVLFKNIVKKPDFERLNSKADEVNFENLVTNDEFERMMR